MIDRAHTLPLDPESEAKLERIVQRIREAILASSPRGWRQIKLTIVGQAGRLSDKTTIGYEEDLT